MRIKLTRWFGNSQGFALVVSLTLMGFMLLLVLTLTTLLQVETSLATNTKNRQQAELNALYALQEALGELQLHAGPDQRVTAQGSIAGSIQNVSGDYIEFGEVANPYYTLVWDVSGAAGQTPGSRPGHDSGLKPAVLISGNGRMGFDFTKGTAYPEGYVTEATSLNENDDGVVVLANAKGVATSRIKAPKVSLDAGLGAYGWWIGDENVKARLNLNEPYNGQDHPDSAWLAPRRWGAQLTSVLQGVKHSELENLYTHGQIPMLDGVGGTLSHNDIFELSMDYSLNSESLLVDVRNGGLKKDLSYGLPANNQPAEIADAVYLFPRDLGGAPDQYSYNLNFIQWGVIRSFYNMRSGSGVIGTRPHRVALSENNANYDMGLRPIITNFQFGIYADYDADDTIRFHYMPVVELWNPYNVDIKIPNLHLIFKEHRNDNEVEIRQITVENDPDVQNQTFSMKSMPFSISSVVIPSGKSVIFTPPDAPAGSYNEFTPSTGGYGNYLTGATTRNWLNPGYRQGTSYVQRSNIKKSLTGNPRLRFSLRLDRPLYLDLHEPLSTGINKDSSRMYQLVTGMSPNTQLGSSTVQYYVPVVGGYPAPKFLLAYAMPFAGKDYFDLSLVPRQWVGMFNPRAAVNTADKVNFGYSDLGNYVGGFMADSDAEANYQIQTLDGVHGLVGTAPLWGAERAVLFEIPDAPLISLGQLAHADLLTPPSTINVETAGRNIMDGVGNHAGDAMQALRLSFTGTGDDFSPAYTVGTGRASPYIDLKGSGTDTTRYWRIFNKGTVDTRMVWDFPYLVNEALFDRYYFSTIPQSGAIQTPLRNPLMKINGDPSALTADLRSFERAAAHMSVAGGFNVNSTSVEAWSSVLAAMRDQDYDGESGVGSLYARFSRKQGAKLDASDQSAYEPETVTGYRRLSDAEIRDLAERIVEQVKLRGPFPSMAAFVNRVMWEDSLYRDDAELAMAAPDRHSLYGSGYNLEEMVMRQSALEAALALSDANANYFGSGEKIDTSEASKLSGTASNNRGFRGAIGQDTPGYLSPVDILSRLAPVMTVRSDTFVIRAYGEAINPLTGRSSAQAWCEAVVQRVPEYVSPNDNDAYDRPAELSEANQKMGRAFRLVSFRWLTQDEI